MYVNRLAVHPCLQEGCMRIALYEFTDVRFRRDIKFSVNDDGDFCAGDSKETIILGHSCEHHVEEVNKMLKDGGKNE